MSRLPKSIEFAKEVPSGRSTSVRAQLDVATGGGAIGRALVGLGGTIADIGFDALDAQRRIEAKKQQLLDVTGEMEVDALMAVAKQDNKTFRQLNADTQTWTPDFVNKAKGVQDGIAGLNVSDDQRVRLNAKFQAWLNENTATTEFAAIRQLKIDTQEAATNNVIEGFRSGDPVREKDVTRYFGIAFGDSVDPAEMRRRFEKAKNEGLKLRRKDDFERILGAAVAIRNENEEIDQDKAFAFIDKSGLSNKDKTSLKSRVAGQKRNEETETARKADDAMVQMILDMSANTDKPLSEREGLQAKILAQLSGVKGLTRESVSAMTTYARNWTARREVRTQKFTEAELYDLAGTLNLTSSAEDIANVRKQIISNFDVISSNDFKTLMKRVSDLQDRAITDVIDQVTRSAIGNGLVIHNPSSGFSEKADYQKAVWEFVRTTTPPPGPREIYIHATVLANTWVTLTAAQKREKARGPEIK